jgi:hypothetical protein
MSQISTRATPIGRPIPAATSAGDPTWRHRPATARQWALNVGDEVAAKRVAQTNVSNSISWSFAGRVRPRVMVYGRATLPGSSSGWSSNHRRPAITYPWGSAAHHRSGARDERVPGGDRRNGGDATTWQQGR